MLKFITSQKRTRKLVVGGFLFTKHRNGADGKEIWRCEERNCRVRIHTLNNANIEEVGTHSHAVTHGRVSAEEARSEMKRQGRETEEPSIYFDIMESNSNNKADAEIKLHNEEVLKNLKPGDLIKIYRDFYNHWAVYIGQEEGVEKVVHWWKGDGTKFRTSILAKVIWAFIKIDKFRKIADSGEAHVKIDSFWTVVGNSKAENGNNKDLENGNIDNSQVVLKAKLLKEKTEQGEQFYNSEHFANWCRYGQPNTSSEGISKATDKSKLILGFNQMTKHFVSCRIDQTSTDDKVDDKIKEHNLQFLKTLKIGDLIKFPRRFYYHWAVYIGKEDDTDAANVDPKVIHWWGPPDFRTSKKGASIMKTSFWDAARNSKAEKGNEIDLEKGNINGHRVAARAEAKQSLMEDKLLNETYNIMFNNCEYFAKWCRYDSDDDDKVQESPVQESPREDHRVFFEIEDDRTRAALSELSRIYRNWTFEKLKGNEQVKILRKEVRQLTQEVSVFKDKETMAHKRVIGGIIFIFVITKFRSWLVGRLLKSAQGSGTPEVKKSGIL